ncbi:SDR family oxidoreductase [soil metagenome]
MTQQFNGLTAIVTGGASGIGASVVERFLEGGANVGVLDLNLDGNPHGAFGVVADLGEDGSVRDAITRTANHFGGIDIVVNNAGIGAQGTIEDNPDEEWERVLGINVIGIARTSRAALPYLRRSAAGAIVNMCSIAATAGLPNRAVYSASKGAVLALTRAMAADLVREGIRVNCVNPGTADTPWVSRLLQSSGNAAGERAALEARQPHGRLVSPAEVAEAVAYLADPRNGSTTGTSISVDGGMQGLRLPAPR